MGISRQHILPNWVCNLGVPRLTSPLPGQHGYQTEDDIACRNLSIQFFFSFTENPKEIF